jgi:hypothetical protein
MRKPCRHSRFAGAIVLTSVCLGTMPVLADEGVDEQRINALFAEARAAFVAKDFTEACPKFEEVVRLKPGLGARLGLGDCYRAQGRLAKAWEVYIGVLDDVPDLVKQAKGPVEQSKVKKRGEEATGRIKEIEPKLGWMVLVVPEAVSGLEGLALQVDGMTVERTKFGVRLPMDRGEHVVEVSAKGKKAWDKTVALVEGAELPVAIQPLEDEVTPGKTGPTGPTGSPKNDGKLPPGPTPLIGEDKRPPVGPNLPPDTKDTKKDFFSTQRIVGMSLGAVGLGGVIAGAVFGNTAIEKRDASEADGHCVANRCDAIGLPLRRESLSAANASTGLFIGGGVALAAGITLFLTAPKRPSPVQASVVLGPSSLYCIGRF